MPHIQSTYSGLSTHLPSKTTKLDHHHLQPHFPHKSSFTHLTKVKRAPSFVLHSSNNNLTPLIVEGKDGEQQPRSGESQPLVSGSDVVRRFYDGINRRDLASVEILIAQNCVYEDLVFPQPFVGRKSILDFFGKFIDSISTDLQFVIDAISQEDSSAVGVTWHLEWKGRAFPFSKGCSFYQLEVINGVRQIIYGRDSVEPAIKPGEAALVAIQGVTWLLQRFPNLADRL